MSLLGAGESGKSTILKQMKLIHDGGYSQDERESFREIIYSNTTQSMRVILEAMEAMGLDFANPQNHEYASIILEQPPQIELSDVMPQEATSAVKHLWQDPSVKVAFSRSSLNIN
ncbi:guanine nucleotide-binding protein subunit alpha [Umbelopsis sp. WA50703]